LLTGFNVNGVIEGERARALSSSPLKRQNKMKKTTNIFLAAGLIVNICLSSVFAGTGVELNDADLDTVYAEGMFLDFDVSFGNPDDILKSSSFSPQDNGVTGDDIVYSDNGNIQLLDPARNPESLSEEASSARQFTFDDFKFSAAASNGDNNVVMIQDSSQQYLSSLVNINAAGSVVPVQLNITVNINSTIENLTNSNKLELSNNNQFNFYR
jgi:hypothetical protein